MANLWKETIFELQEHGMTEAVSRMEFEGDGVQDDG